MKARRNLVSIFLFLGIINAHGQFNSARELSLGGSAISNQSGSLSLFVNPANLFLETETSYKWSITLPAVGALLIQPDISNGRFTARENLENVFESTDQVPSPLTPSDLGSVRGDLFNGSGKGVQQAQINLTWFAASYRMSNATIAIGMRTRYHSEMRTGSGWFENNLPTDSTALDRSFSQLHHSMHEISIGYAAQFEFLTGLTPSLNRLVFGFAPKLLLPGSYLQTRWKSQTQLLNDGRLINVHEARIRSSGTATQVLENQLSGTPPPQFDISDLTEITGWGMAVDVGLTYSVPLGKRIRISPLGGQGITLSGLQISVVLKDIGFIKQKQNLGLLVAPSDTLIINGDFGSANRFATGAIDDFLPFISQDAKAAAQLGRLQDQTPSSLNRRLPPRFLMGITFTLPRITLVSELAYTTTDLRDDPDFLRFNIAGEVRPLHLLPLRASLLLQQDVPLMSGLGTGIDLKNISLNVGLLIQPDKGLLTDESLKGFAADLSIHF